MNNTTENKTDSPKKNIKFSELGLSEPILKAITEEGYEIPTPIQAQAIPAVLAGRDVMAAAQTGTGKTAGFILPILNRLSRGGGVRSNHAKALIITPTRELAAQIGESATTYGRHLPLSSTVVFGGVKINPQMMKLRRGVDILVATPGRLLDLFRQKAIKFNQIEVLVLDEADRMLDMGFIHDIRKILSLLPKKRQNLLFSATFSVKIRNLAKGLINNPVEISVTPRNTTVEKITQWIYPVDKKQKTALLIKLIIDNQWNQVLVFCRTKHGSNRLTQNLMKRKISALAIHGNKSQSARTKALANFKAGKVQVLVATDIAARGIDIDQLPHVVNFDLPEISESYIHRIGRTGRAGTEGEAVSLVCADEFKYLKDIERLTKQVINRKIVAGYEPVHDLPESILDTRGPKRIRPKKPKAPHQEHRDGQRSGQRNGQANKPRHTNTKQSDKPRHNSSKPSRTGSQKKEQSGNRPNNNRQGRPKPSGNR